MVFCLICLFYKGSRVILPHRIEKDHPSSIKINSEPILRGARTSTLFGSTHCSRPKIMMRSESGLTFPRLLAQQIV